MRYKKLGQDGLTALELLATLSIMAVVGTFIFNIFFMGKDLSDEAQSTVSIQQEANRILTEITSMHETVSEYDIKLTQNLNDTSISLIPYDSNGNELTEKVISTPGYNYKICYDRTQETSTCNETTKNVTQKNLPLKLYLERANDNKINFEIQTIISRM